MDHGSGACWEGFVVAGESAVEHQPADRALDDPPPVEATVRLTTGLPDGVKRRDGSSVMSPTIVAVLVSEGMAWKNAC